jgi:hypothetical protein
MTRYVVKTRADSPALRKAAIAIEQSAWGPLGFLNFTRAHFASPEGWDWIVESAASNDAKRRNAIGALAISVPNVHRGKGLARRMIDEFRNLAERRGLDGVVAPVRPSAKHLHPFIPMHEYLGWRDERGRLFDPWLRSHASAGGRIVKPADRSMIVEEPVAFWEMWTGRTFEKSGDYAIEGALSPVAIDLERGEGRYVEPNVWFAYKAA